MLVSGIIAGNLRWHNSLMVVYKQNIFSIIHVMFLVPGLGVSKKMFKKTLDSNKIAGSQSPSFTD